MKNKKEKRTMLFLLVLLAITVGYALLSQQLNINGTAKIDKTTWKIIWNNVQVTNGSVTGDQVVQEPTIDTNKTTVEYSINLKQPREYYEFTIDAKNEGTIDGMIDVISNKIYESDGVTEVNTTPAYLNYKVTYSDGIELAQKHLLKSGEAETYKVRIEFKDVEASQLPSSADRTLKFKFSVDYIQADENAITVDHSFNAHSWATIISNVKSGKTSNYNVGDTKTVDMGTLGIHTLRIANKSTPSECSTTGFSQTACGFVLEFADVITTHRMNPYEEGVTTTGNGNIGGWPASEMRTYVNSDIYNALPSELKSGIINTTVVSGHGSTSGETNFSSIDKLYLLSSHEVWKEGNVNTNSGIDYYDTAYNNTRQLDYYSSQNVQTGNYSRARKQYNGSVAYWWLRSTRSLDNGNFFSVFTNGAWLSNKSDFTYGVSPAFRIG